MHSFHKCLAPNKTVYVLLLQANLVVGDRGWLVGMFTLHDSIMLRRGGYVHVGHGRLDVDRTAQRQWHQLFGERNDGWQDVLDEVQHLHCTLNTRNTQVEPSTGSKTRQNCKKTHS